VFGTSEGNLFLPCHSFFRCFGDFFPPLSVSSIYLPARFFFNHWDLFGNGLTFFFSGFSIVLPPLQTHVFPHTHGLPILLFFLHSGLRVRSPFMETPLGPRSPFCVSQCHHPRTGMAALHDQSFFFLVFLKMALFSGGLRVGQAHWKIHPDSPSIFSFVPAPPAHQEHARSLRVLIPLSHAGLTATPVVGFLPSRQGALEILASRSLRFHCSSKPRRLRSFFFSFAPPIDNLVPLAFFTAPFGYVQKEEVRKTPFGSFGKL